MYKIQYTITETVSFEIPNHSKIGFDKIADEEPVMANTKIMTKICQLEFICQRFLKLFI